MGQKCEKSIACLSRAGNALLFFFSGFHQIRSSPTSKCVSARESELRRMSVADSLQTSKFAARVANWSGCQPEPEPEPEEVAGKRLRSGNATRSRLFDAAAD